MHVGELLCQIAEQGVTLRCGKTEDRLHYTPAGALPPNLVAELKAPKPEVIQSLGALARMAGYRRGTLSLHALSAAVAAALGRSPHAWVERLKPVVEQVLKRQKQAPDVDDYSAKR